MQLTYGNHAEHLAACLLAVMAVALHFVLQCIAPISPPLHTHRLFASPPPCLSLSLYLHALTHTHTRTDDSPLAKEEEEGERIGNSQRRDS